MQMQFKKPKLKNPDRVASMHDKSMDANENSEMDNPKSPMRYRTNNDNAPKLNISSALASSYHKRYVDQEERKSGNLGRSMNSFNFGSAHEESKNNINGEQHSDVSASSLCSSCSEYENDDASEGADTPISKAGGQAFSPSFEAR